MLQDSTLKPEILRAFLKVNITNRIICENAIQAKIVNVRNVISQRTSSLAGKNYTTRMLYNDVLGC